MYEINTPLTNNTIIKLKKDIWIELTGTIYTARDQAHKKLIELLQKKEPLPFPAKGSIIYYTGPSPTPQNHIIGSVGPTTSSRMDKFTPSLIDAGIKGFIGKGPRSSEVIHSIQKNKCVYFEIPGGIGALISNYIKHVEIIAYPELKTEAIRILKVEKLPLKVSII